jgi:hypothetical protein
LFERQYRHRRSFWFEFVFDFEDHVPSGHYVFAYSHGSQHCVLTAVRQVCSWNSQRTCYLCAALSESTRENFFLIKNTICAIFNIYPTRCNVTQFIYLETVLHVSGSIITHHQERKQLYLQHLLFVRPLLLSAAVALLMMGGGTTQNM